MDRINELCKQITDAKEELNDILHIIDIQTSASGEMLFLTMENDFLKTFLKHNVEPWDHSSCFHSRLYVEANGIKFIALSRKIAAGHK